jgi:hypothetical protein
VDARQDVAPPPPPRLLGEVCFDGSQAGPRLQLHFAIRNGTWVGEPSDVAAPLRRGRPSFTVFAVDGRRDGVFRPWHAVGSGPAGVVRGAYGPDRYRGWGPCALGREPRLGKIVDGACQGCGIAVAHVGSDVDGVQDVTRMCMAEHSLVADMDGDGKAEAFALDALFETPTAPEHLDGVEAGTGTCSAKRFAWWQPAIGGSRKPDTTYVDVLGVADFDGDGRREVVLAVRSGPVSRLVVYRAARGAVRLDQIAVSRGPAAVR